MRWLAANWMELIALCTSLAAIAVAIRAEVRAPKRAAEEARAIDRAARETASLRELEPITEKVLAVCRNYDRSMSEDHGSRGAPNMVRMKLGGALQQLDQSWTTHQVEIAFPEVRDKYGHARVPDLVHRLMDPPSMTEEELLELVAETERPVAELENAIHRRLRLP